MSVRPNSLVQIHYPDITGSTATRIGQLAAISAKLRPFEKQSRFDKVGHLLWLCFSPALDWSRYAINILVIERIVEPFPRWRKEWVKILSRATDNELRLSTFYRNRTYIDISGGDAHKGEPLAIRTRFPWL